MSLFHHKQIEGATDFVDKLIEVSFGNNYSAILTDCEFECYCTKQMQLYKILDKVRLRNQCSNRDKYFVIQSQKLETCTHLIICTLQNAL
jgi:hypothetical protein